MSVGGSGEGPQKVFLFHGTIAFLVDDSHAQLVYVLLIGAQSIGVPWFQSSDESNQQNL